MSRFSEVNYDSSSQTVTFGSGLIWDDVYAALAPYGVNVVGGRVSGVGVAGFTLGGGMFYWILVNLPRIDHVCVPFRLLLEDEPVRTDCGHCYRV